MLKQVMNDLNRLEVSLHLVWARYIRKHGQIDPDDPIAAQCDLKRVDQARRDMVIVLGYVQDARNHLKTSILADLDKKEN